MDVSCALAPCPSAVDHVVAAEALGYRRAWCYDSPALYGDVWMVLALAAARTTTIELGPAVLVPSLRHPMVNAAAIATLAELAPGRVNLAIGAGFTGRYALGQKPMRWADVEAYVRALRGLLAGETVTWEGAPIRMLHSAGFAPPRPLDVPVLIGADGPKGAAVAEAVGDGVYSTAPPARAAARQAVLRYGTVLMDGEAFDSPRVVEAAGHGVALAYHALFELRGPEHVRELPGGERWLAAMEDVDPGERHLLTHEGHLVTLTERDRAALASGGAELIATHTLSGTPAEIRERLAALADAGISEIAYQPAGPDVTGELERFAAAAGIS